jgi:hypothetical protein
MRSLETRYKQNVLLLGLLSLMWIITNPVKGQLPGWSLETGITVQLGVPVQGIGVQMNARYDRMEGAWLLGGRMQFYQSQLGPSSPFRERVLWSGIRVGVGPEKNLLASDAPLRFSPLVRGGEVGYSVFWYLDNRMTSQLTGGVLVRAGNWWMEVENDAFAPGRPRDRFRTGGLRIGWQRGMHRLEGRVILWHGDTKGEKAANVRQSDYPGRFGYRDFTDSRYGKFSNGIIALDYAYFLPSRQSLHIQGGVDAEQVRHFFQNRLIHDMWWIPKQWTSVRNPHYPMLDEEGKPFLGQPGQRIRPVRPVIQVGLNQQGLY